MGRRCEQGSPVERTRGTARGAACLKGSQLTPQQVPSDLLMMRFGILLFVIAAAMG